MPDKPLPIETALLEVIAKYVKSRQQQQLADQELLWGFVLKLVNANVVTAVN
jgi:hypothetical protein